MSPRYRRFALSCALALSISGLISCGNKQEQAGQAQASDTAHTNSPVVVPVDLRCEGKTDPIAVGKTPQLSWRLEAGESEEVKELAWRIKVASSPELLKAGKADLWDSGKTPSGRSPLIPYAGTALTSGQTCHWKVRVWDQTDEASDWSKVASFEVAPTTPEDWAGAKWIFDGKANPQKDEDCYKLDPAPLFRKEFKLEKPIKQARLHVVGLGLCYPSLNGERIKDHLLDPPWTDFQERIQFRTHDVTSLLVQGDNCLGIALGNGFFNPLPMRKWGRRNLRGDLFIGRPRVIAKLVVTHEDGSETLLTTGGEGWKFGHGASLRNNIYIGEIRDARKAAQGWDKPGFKDTDWHRAAVIEAPLEPLEPLRMLPVRAHETLSAVNITEPKKDGVYVVDFGLNHTGIPEIDFNVPAGTEITLRYGELVYDDGTLNPMTSVTGQIKRNITLDDGTVQSMGGPGAPEIAWQEDIYIAKGGGETFSPDYTYHSYRYMEVAGLPKAPKKEDFRAIAFSTELPTAGTFESSNELLNRIQQLCLNTFVANTVAVQSDCPHRERFGYGGDIVATSETFLMNYDMNGFYTKTLRDWGDAQLENGLMPDTAPYAGVKYCGVGWGMVHPLLIEQLYQHYGNKELLEEQLPTALEWIEAEANRRKDALVMVGLGDHEALLPGDQKKGPELKTPKFIDSCLRIARLARIIGDEASAKQCEAWAKESQAAWEKAYLDKDSGKVGFANQTQQAFALGFGVVPADDKNKVFNVLITDLTKSEDSPRLTTGIYGTWKLLELLPENGRNDLAYGLANRKTEPSWGWMLENDATTLWEHWAGSDNTFSNNHPMFGSVSGWFLRWLGGIQCAPDAVGFDRILIRPRPVEDLDWVNSSHDSIRGTIVSNWKRMEGEGGIEYEITIPPNTTATLELPNDGGFIRKEVGSGTYRFKVK